MSEWVDFVPTTVCIRAASGQGTCPVVFRDAWLGVWWCSSPQEGGAVWWSEEWVLGDAPAGHSRARGVPMRPTRRWGIYLFVRLHVLLPLNPEQAGRWVGSYVLITTSAARLTQGVPWLCVPLSREVCPYLLLRREHCRTRFAKSMAIAEHGCLQPTCNRSATNRARVFTNRSSRRHIPPGLSTRSVEASRTRDPVG
jgi:hypothetical protein